MFYCSMPSSFSAGAEWLAVGFSKGSGISQGGAAVFERLLVQQAGGKHGIAHRVRITVRARTTVLQVTLLRVRDTARNAH